MSVMETMQVQGDWTYADLADLPDDGFRYEIIDGVLLVNASPRPSHQGVVLSLAIALRQAAPEDFKVHVAPLDVVLANDTVVEPDVLVAPAEAFSELNLPAPPLLAVEVLSPSTRRIDLSVKKERYERAGIASYWVVDADDLTMTVLELQPGGRYGQVAEVLAEQTWTASAPFPVTITPAELRY